MHQGLISPLSLLLLRSAALMVVVVGLVELSLLVDHCRVLFHFRCRFRYLLVCVSVNIPHNPYLVLTSKQ